MNKLLPFIFFILTIHADILEKHPEWELYKRYETFPGFTILKRTNVDDPNVGPVGKLG